MNFHINKPIFKGQQLMSSVVNKTPLTPFLQQRAECINTSTTLTSALRSPRSTILLATALIQVVNKWGAFSLCRSLLDSGSQLNFVSERLAVQLGLRRQHALTDIDGIGDTHTSVRHYVTITFQSRINSFTTQLDFYVLPRISAHQPEFHFDISEWNFPTDITLADPAFYNPQKIDILLGAEIFFDLLLREQLRLSSKLPVLQNTKLGWIVAGKLTAETKSSFQCIKTSTPSIASLELLLRQFWEIEAHSTPTKTFTAEEKMCETHFITTVKRSEGGRFIVKLPFRQAPTVLGDSFYTARRRLLSMEDFRKIEVCFSSILIL